MPRFLIDARTISTFWVDAETVEEAKRLLHRAGRLMDPMLVGSPDVELVNFNIAAEPELVEIDCGDCGRCDDYREPG